MSAWPLDLRLVLPRSKGQYTAVSSLFPPPSGSRTFIPQTMVMVVTLTVVLLVLARRSCPFNLNTDTELARLLPGPNQTYFGYSVALWVDVAGAARLVVGAPRGRNTTAGSHILPLGVLHICEVFGSDCPNHPNLPTFSKKDNSAKAVFWGEGIKKQGIGFTEAIYTANHGRSILVACAPRYSTAETSTSLQPRGACYIIKDAFVSSVRRIVPFKGPIYCYDAQGDVKCDFNNHRFTGFSMAGYSVAFNQNQTRMFMGSPYAFRGQGAVVSRPTSGKAAGLTLSRTYYGEKNLDFSNEGWAVVMAKFDGESDMVAVSSPNREVFKGVVNFYTEGLVSVPELTRYGSDVGAKFGFSMASGDLDGDGADDLAVGAPLASGAVSGPDAGKVIVYYTPGKQRASSLVLEGQVIWGRFGQAVTSPGDLNLDGYEDLVIGAPNEGPGAVYVFNGSPDGLLQSPTQRIHASQFSPYLRGFGFSLSGGQDMDGNGYPDLLVGAPESDTSVFLRSAPVVSLEGSVAFEPPVVELEGENCTVALPGGSAQAVACFHLVVDLWYTTPTNEERPLEMVLELHLDERDSRLAFLDNHRFRLAVTRNITSSGEPPRPWRIPAYVKPGRPQKETPLTATLRARLQPSEVGDEYPKEVPPVLSRTSFEGLARLVYDNASAFFQPDLVLTAQAPSEMIIGSETLAVQVELTVLNDTAQSTQLFVDYPSVLSLGKISGKTYLPYCRANPTVQHRHSHTCTFSSDILKDEQVPITLYFEYDPQTLLDHLLASSTMEVSLSLNVSSDSVDLNEEDNAVNLTVQMVTHSELYVIASSFPGVVEAQAKELAGLEVFRSPQPMASPLLLGPQVSMNFYLTNQGPSPLLTAKMLLRLPLRLSNEGPPLLYFLEPPKTSNGVTCSPLPLNPNELEFISTHDGREDALDDDLDTDEGEDIPVGVSGTTGDRLVDFDPNTTTAEAQSPQGNAPEGSRRRRRRQADPTSPPNSTAEPEPLGTTTAAATDEGMADNFTNGDMGSNDQALTLGCDKVPCEVITCDVSTLAVGRRVTVTVSGYIVIAALQHVGRLVNIQSVRLESLVSVYVTENFGLVTGDLHNQTVTIQASLAKDTYKLPFGIKWWHWLLVLILSILSLLIMIAILQKVGFFKRTLPPGVEQDVASPKQQENCQDTTEASAEECKS